jgi:cell wall assembly regulator SMI1
LFFIQLFIQIIENKTNMKKFISLLEKIKNFYKENAPAHIKFGAHLKATEEQIVKLESAIGEKLPDDYRTFLLHNDFEIFFNHGYNSLSIEKIMYIRNIMNEHLKNGVFDDGRIQLAEEAGNFSGEFIQKTWWSNKWLPFSEDSCGNMHCIDFEPGKNGNIYQILMMEIQDGQGPFIYKDYNNFQHYLEKHLQYLQLGKFYINEFGDGSKMICVDSYI